MDDLDVCCHATRLGAGRSQVQILSPRLELPANDVVRQPGVKRFWGSILSPGCNFRDRARTGAWLRSADPVSWLHPDVSRRSAQIRSRPATPAPRRAPGAAAGTAAAPVRCLACSPPCSASELDLARRWR